MLFKILLVTAAVGWSRSPGVVTEYTGDTARAGTNYATPSPTPYSEPSYHGSSSEYKSFKDDDRRIYNGGPSHARTGPPKHLGPGPAPLSYSSPGVPLSLPQRYLPPGSVIGYLAYPQPLVPALHDSSAGLLPSAAFSHIAYASPLSFTHYPKPVPLGPGPGYSPVGHSYSSGGPGYGSGPHSSYK